MSNTRGPRLKGHDLAAVGVAGIIALMVLGLMAMHEGLDGALFAAVVSGIAAIIAGLGGFILAGK